MDAETESSRVFILTGVFVLPFEGVADGDHSEHSGGARGHCVAGCENVLQHLPRVQEPHQPDDSQGDAHSDAERHLLAHGESSGEDPRFVSLWSGFRNWITTRWDVEEQLKELIAKQLVEIGPVFRQTACCRINAHCAIMRHCTAALLLCLKLHLCLKHNLALVSSAATCEQLRLCGLRNLWLSRFVFALVAFVRCRKLFPLFVASNFLLNNGNFLFALLVSTSLCFGEKINSWQTQCVTMWIYLAGTGSHTESKGSRRGRRCSSWGIQTGGEESNSEPLVFFLGSVQCFCVIFCNCSFRNCSFCHRMKTPSKLGKTVK